MENKDVEKYLLEQAEKVPMQDFEEIWQKIKGEIEAPVVKKKRKPAWVYALASFAACLILFCAVGIPIILNNRNDDIVYFDDNLVSVQVDEKTFFDGITSSDVSVLDLTKYKSESGTFLLKTEDDIVKGGKISFFNNNSNPMFYVDLNFYDDSVKKKDNIDYDKTYNTNGASIEYRFLYEQDSSWNYLVRANYNKVNYYMEIMSATENITLFFDEFFVSDTN